MKHGRFGCFLIWLLFQYYRFSVELYRDEIIYQDIRAARYEENVRYAITLLNVAITILLAINKQIFKCTQFGCFHYNGAKTQHSAC